MITIKNLNTLFLHLNEQLPTKIKSFEQYFQPNYNKSKNSISVGLVWSQYDGCHSYDHPRKEGEDGLSSHPPAPRGDTSSEGSQL